MSGVKITSFKGTAHYRVSPDQVSLGLGNETVILHTKAGIYFGLNETGSFIWAVLQKQPSTLSELSQLVQNEFAVGAETCRIELERLMSELLEEKLVEEIEGGSLQQGKGPESPTV